MNDAEGIPEVLLRLQDPVTAKERAVFDEVCATSDGAGPGNRG